MKIKNNEINYTKVINSLQIALSFISGSYCGPIVLLQKKSETLQYKFNNSLVSIYKYRKNVLFNSQFHEYQEITNKIYFKLKNELWSDPLKSIIQTYITCNNVYNITVEMATILIQSSLEMIAYIVFTEESKLINKCKFDKLDAATKISKILEHFKIPTQVPLEITDRIDIDETQGSKLIIQIRNPFIHPKESYRNKLKKITSQERIAVWELSMWYLELCILKIIGYEGEYSKRIHNGNFEKKEVVPWKIQT